MPNKYAVYEKDLVRLSMLSKPGPFTIDEIIFEFPHTSKDLINDVLNDCLNNSTISYDTAMDAYISNYFNENDHTGEIKPTHFMEWRDSLTIEDFECYLVEQCDEWDCEFLCPAYTVCKNNSDKKYRFCQHPEEFIKWANSEVEDDDN